MYLHMLFTSFITFFMHKVIFVYLCNISSIEQRIAKIRLTKANFVKNSFHNVGRVATETGE